MFDPGIEQEHLPHHAAVHGTFAFEGKEVRSHGWPLFGGHVEAWVSPDVSAFL
jgi:hypothetical protein